MTNSNVAVDSQPTTQDAFFNGRFNVIQPDNGAHRAGLDALLLSACIPLDYGGKIADFGAGAGVAGMAVASRCVAVEVDLVERDVELAMLANCSLMLPANQNMHGRVHVICADISLSGVERENTGLKNCAYDTVIMNPPFNDPYHRASPVLARQEAHIMGEGGLDFWLRSAAATLKSLGKVALIFRPAGLGQILAAFQGRFGNCQIIPIHPKQGEAANRIIVLAKKGARGGASILPGFVVHEADGTFSCQAAEIFSGSAVLPQI